VRSANEFDAGGNWNEGHDSGVSAFAISGALCSEVTSPPAGRDGKSDHSEAGLDSLHRERIAAPSVARNAGSNGLRIRRCLGQVTAFFAFMTAEAGSVQSAHSEVERSLQSVLQNLFTALSTPGRATAAGS